VSAFTADTLHLLLCFISWYSQYISDSYDKPVADLTAKQLGHCPMGLVALLREILKWPSLFGLLFLKKLKGRAWES